MSAVVQPGHLADSALVCSALAKLAETSGARSLGLPVADPLAARAQSAEGHLESFLRQAKRAPILFARSKSCMS